MASQSFLQLPLCQAKTVISRQSSRPWTWTLLLHFTQEILCPTFLQRDVTAIATKVVDVVLFWFLQLSQLQYWQLLHYGLDIQVNLCWALCLMLLTCPLLFINGNYLANIFQCVQFSSFNGLLIFPVVHHIPLLCWKLWRKMLNSWRCTMLDSIITDGSPVLVGIVAVRSSLWLAAFTWWTVANDHLKGVICCLNHRYCNELW